MLATLKKKYIKDELKKMIDENQLNDEQVQYVIKNTNINEYISYNTLIIAKALKDEVSIEAIEYTAGLLNDMCGVSEFALENGRGFLFNKDGSILKYLLNTTNVKSFTELDKIKLKKAVEIYNVSRNMRTIKLYRMEKLWELIIENNSINEINCSLIEKYNNSVVDFFTNGHDISEKIVSRPPYINDLLEIGLTLDEIANIDFKKVELFNNLILKNSNYLMKNDKFKEIIYETDNCDFYLKLEKVDCVRLVSDLSEDTGVREEYYKDVVKALMLKEDEDKYFILKENVESNISAHFIQFVLSNPNIEFIYDDKYTQKKEDVLDHIKENDDLKKLSIYEMDDSNKLEYENKLVEDDVLEQEGDCLKFHF